MARSRTLTLLGWLIAQSAAAQTWVVPNAPDLMIKTRRTVQGVTDTVGVLYLKGARQRQEMVFGPSVSARHRLIHVTQCDEHRRLLLNDQVKTYAYEPIEDPSAANKRLQAMASSPMPPSDTPTGPVTIITIDTVDTGERRPFRYFSARHVITTTTTTEPGLGGVPRVTEKRDGWYIDVPDQSCWEPGAQTELLITPVGARIEHRGNVHRGYPIEETDRSESGPRTIVAKLDVVESSDARLDDALFTVPAGYRAALPTSYGYDLTKPDTLMNRLTVYRDVVVSWANSLFRSYRY
jgi:hypothetical protein